MTDEIGSKETATDGVNVADETKNDNETKEPKETKTVSFNKDVHVKRFGKPRESRSTSSEKQSSIRKEPFTHLSERELIDEANKVLEQAKSVSCTADHPPEKFFSLPHRRKFKEDRSDRRNSDDSTDAPTKSSLGRSTSDVGNKRRKERTSLSTLFRRAQKTKAPDAPVVVSTKPKTTVKRSKSDVSDLKSNTNLNKPIRKRSGSESEEFLKSLRNKKSQLSPIIESSPREDYFKKTPPLEAFLKQKQAQKESTKSDDNNSSTDSKKVNPIEKPPRYKSTDKADPKPPARTKRGKSSEKDKEGEVPITETPKRKIDVRKTLLVDEIDSVTAKDIHPVEVKERIKDQIRKIEENIYGDKEMIHSSQKPPDKLPLTRGNTVDHIVKILKNDQFSPPPKSHLISPSSGTNVNQPFSYTKPSVSPDPNLFTRTTSPERVLTPVNKMPTEEAVYAKVVKDLGMGDSGGPKKPVQKMYSPSRERNINMSDEDEGLGYEDRYKYSPNRDYNHHYKSNDDDKFNSFEGYKITDSPIKPRYREYKLTSFADIEPTYANEYTSEQNRSHTYIDSFRGRGDGMDTKRSPVEVDDKIDLEFNELSHRRQLLESRLNARRFEREKTYKAEPMSRYVSEVVPSYEADKRKATEKFVNETLRYRNTLERDGYTESSVTEDYTKYDSNTNHKIKYNTESRSFQKVSKGDIDRREFIDHLDSEPKHIMNMNDFPPEPEYEPPSLEFIGRKPMKSPEGFKEKKHKVKKLFSSSREVENGKCKAKDESFGKRKGHYASNPEIVSERDDDYVNVHNKAKHTESYHNSLRRMKNKDKYYKTELGVKRHDSGDSRDYNRDDRSPRRFEIDSRLVDSGIENDFRKESSGEIHGRHRPYESDEEVRNTSMLLASERRHTEDNYYPSEQIYANGEYVAKFKDYDDDFTLRERRGGSHLDPKPDKYDRSPSGPDERVSAKPPKATKKLSGLEKVKQLFSRDSSKKSKKEKEIVPSKNRTRVLKSPEHLDKDDSEYKRYTDPEPSDLDDRKTFDPKLEERRYRSSREDLDRRGSDGRDSDPDRKYREDYKTRYERTMKEDRKYKSNREEKRRHHSSDRESDMVSRPSDAESELRKSRSRTAGPTRPLDSPALAERYRERRRLATPSPTPSPPRRQPEPPATSGWFKSLDRLGRKKGKSTTKVEKESVLTTEEEPRKTWSKPVKPLNSPAKNLRFFGDTDQDSDATTKNSVTKSKSHPSTKTTLRKTISNSSTGLDEVDHTLTSKSYSLTNLHKNDKQYRINLQNISEIQSNSEAESQIGKINRKPPINPYDRSRSHSSSKTLKGSKGDVRRYERSEERGSSELRGSKQELSRDTKHRRRTPAPNSGESSTEGDSSHQSQRSVVFLHATTVGDIPNPDRLTRNRSRDDVSSVNSSNIQVRNTTKSFSIFAPWTPRHYSNERDVHYSQQSRTKPREFSKSSSTKNLSEDRPNLQKNKSYSQTTLTRRPQNNRLTSSSTTLYRKPEKRAKENDSVISSTRRSEKRGDSVLSSTLKPRRDEKKRQSNEMLNDRDRISRSSSMPRDGKKAGWFKLTNKNKKQEVNTRVR